MRLGWSIALSVVVLGCSGVYPDPAEPSSIAPDAGPNTLVEPDAGTVSHGPLGFPLDVGPDRDTCLGSATTIGPAPEPGYTYRWTPSTGLSDPTVAQPSASPTQNTRYVVQATAPNGRVGVGVVWVNVHGLPSAPALSDVQVCAGATVTLGAPAVDGLRYEWSPADGLDDPTAAQPHASPASSTTYSLRVTDAYGCSASAPVSVSVRPAPVASISGTSGLPVQANVCPGGSWSLSALGSTAAPGTIASYLWQFADGSQSADPEPVIPASAANSGPATLTVVDSAGCWASTTQTLGLFSPPSLEPMPAQSIDPGQSATLSAVVTGAGPFVTTWTSNNPACAGAPCIAAPDSATTLVSPTSSTDFSIAITDANGCTTQGSTSVAVAAAALAANPGPSVGICAGDSVLIGGAATGGVAPYSYQWSSDVSCAVPGCIDDPNLAFPMVSPAQTTTFTQLVQDGAGAQASGSTVVTVSPVPGVAGPDEFIDPGASVALGSAPVGGATYAWTCDRPDCALSATDQAQPVAAPLLSTQYGLAATSGPGCQRFSSAIVWVQLKEQSVPLDGTTSFPVNDKLKIQLDRPALASTVNAANIELTDAVSGASVPVTLAYDAPTQMVTITPPAAGTNGYSAGNDYTLTLHGGVGGLVSDDPVRPNIFFGDVNVDFTTSAADTTPPTVVYRSPAPGSSDVAFNTAVEAAFSEPLDPTTVNDQTFQLLVNSQPVAGTVSYDFGSATAIFTPSAPLPVSSTVTVAISGVEDLSGNAGSDSWTFSTGTTADTLPPSVTAVSPVDGAVAVLSNATVSVTFSEPINPATLGGFQVSNSGTGAVLGGTVAYDSPTQTATFTPAALLDGNSSFTVSVTGVQDLAGNSLSPAFSSTFRTMRTLFSDDFESGTAQWSLTPDAAGDSWALTDKSFSSATHSLTDSPNGKYGVNQTSTAQLLNPIDITGVSHFTVLLSVRTRLGGHNAPGNFFVDYALDDGAWTQLGTSQSGNLAWTRLTLPVDVSGATRLSLRLRLQTGAKKYDGVYVDDVVVQAP